MEILLTVILGFFLYILFKIGYKVFLFWRQYKNVINQFRNVQQNGGFGSGFNGSANTYENSSSHRSTSDNVAGTATPPKKKIIPKDEGEYVEFEEV